MSGLDAAVTGWESLRDVLHSRGIRSREGLAEWIHSQGLAMPRWGAHFNARAQERLLNLAITDNASVSGLESLFVQMTLAECRRQVAPVPGLVNNSDHVEHPNAFQRYRAEIPVCTQTGVGEVLDSLNLEGRFRQVARHATEGVKCGDGSCSVCCPCSSSSGRAVTVRCQRKRCATGSICSPQESGRGCVTKFSQQFAHNL